MPLPNTKIQLASKTDKITLEIIRANLKPLALESAHHLGMNQNDATVVEEYRRKHVLSKATSFYNNHLSLSNTALLVIPFLITFANILPPFVSLNPVNFLVTIIVSSAVSVAVSFVLMSAAALFLGISKQVQTAKIRKIIVPEYSPQVAVWLKKIYNISLNDQDLAVATVFICIGGSGMTPWFNTLVNTSTGLKFNIVRESGNKIKLTDAYGSIIQPSDTAVVQQKVSPGLSKSFNTRMVMSGKNSDDNISSFDSKLAILRTLSLTVEQEYAVEHAEKEAEKVNQSMELLQKLNERASLPMLKNSLQVLEQELDNVIKQAKEDEVNRVKSQNIYLNSRSSDGVKLHTNSTFFKKLLKK